MTLGPGDSFALFTDGLTEARNEERELFGAQRLVAALRATEGVPANTALAVAWQAVSDFRDGAPASDDATLLLGRVVPIEDR